MDRESTHSFPAVRVTGKEKEIYRKSNKNVATAQLLKKKVKSVFPLIYE